MKKDSDFRHLICFLVVSLYLMLHTNAFCQQNTSPLCFTARNSSVTVRFDIHNATHTIQYSTDSTNWYNYTSNTNVTIGINQSIYFRAATNQTIATAFGSTSTNNSSRFYFSGGKVEGSGNIMSLYGPDCPNLPLQTNAFTSMFYNCGSLLTAPALPATTLADECYSNMFFDCFSLTMAPILPATTLAYNCYSFMFSGCTSLVTPPALPATTLYPFCYQYMFTFCTSLRILPSLPAVDLTLNCYWGMFSYCSSIRLNITGPGVPWSISADDDSWGVEDMFTGTSGTMNGTPSVNTTYYLDTVARFTVTANANSFVMGSTGGGGVYLRNDTATLTAIPVTNHHLVNWSNGDTARIIKIIVTKDTTLTAYFSSNTHTVACYANDTTMGNVTGGGLYAYNSTATLTATPAANHHLVNWSNGENTQTINIVVTRDSTLIANFAIDTLYVTTNVNDTVMGAVTGGGAYAYGATATLTATPSPNHHFVSWSNGDTARTINFVVTNNTALTAYFDFNRTYYVMAKCNYANRGIVTGGGQYTYGDRATLSATPNDGFVFDSWDNGETNSVIYIAVKNDTVVTAIFVPDGTGVNDVVETEYSVYSNGKNIYVNGADDKSVRVYDMSGKLISEVKAACVTQMFTIETAGVYYVRINETRTIKIIIK